MGKKKMTIRWRLMLYLLFAGMVSFLAFGAVSVLGLYYAQQEAMRSGRDMGAMTETFMVDMTADIAKNRLLLLTQDRSNLVGWELRSIEMDAEGIALVMERILSHPENYLPRQLRGAESDPLIAGKACIYYAPDIRSPEAREALSHEIGLASGIADTLENTATLYAGSRGFFCIASEHGYCITVNTFDKDQDMPEFSEEFLSGYVPKKALWYTEAVQAGKPTFSYLKKDENTSLPFVSVSVPYRRGNEIAGVANISINLLSLYQIAVDKGMGTSGINFLVDNEGDVMFSTEQEGTLAAIDGVQDLRQSEEESLAESVKRMAEGESGVSAVSLNGEDYYLAYAPIPSVDWSFGMMVRTEEVLVPAKNARAVVGSQTEEFVASMGAFFQKNLRETGFVLLFLLVVLAVFSREAARRFVVPILRIREGVRDIAKGDLDRKLDVRTGDEFEELSGSINHMTKELKEYMENFSRVTKDRERTATELSLAQDIQKGMLPGLGSTVPDGRFDLFATMEAERAVGGDFYDFYAIDEEHLAVTIADVSGKGVPAALFMAVSRTILRNCVLELHDASLGERVSHVNNLLRQDNTRRMFVTAFIGVLNLGTGRLCYVNAGHNPPLVYRCGENRYHYLETAHNFILGARQGLRFQEQEVMLAPGDGLFLYTDGVTEAINETEELYGGARLLHTLNGAVSPETSSREILAAVRDSLSAYVGEAEQSDDITMLGLRFLGRQDGTVA